MTTIERAVSAQELYWVKNDAGDRIGLVWGLDGLWHWTVGAKHAKDVATYADALRSVEQALGAAVVDKAHKPAHHARKAA